ncbi:MAG: hypothetical protein KC731_06190 [Myxococcales bacterium]|nr:hypothetical protein [Myxococcales bacterium]
MRPALVLLTIAAVGCTAVAGLDGLRFDGEGAGAAAGGAGGSAGGFGGSDSCPPEHAECNDDPADGCEDLQSDDDHCGRCDHSCAGAGCVGGRCRPEVLVSGELGVQGIALSGEVLYWCNFLDDELLRIDLSAPGASPELVASGFNGCAGVAIADGQIYFAAYFDDQIRRVPLSGGPSEVVVTDPGAGPHGISLDATHLYWTSFDQQVVKRAPRSDPTLVEQLYATGSGATSVMANGPDLFWTTYEGGTVVHADGGGTVTQVAAGQPQAFYLAVEGDQVFWTTRDESAPGGSRVQHASVNGGEVTVLAEDQLGASGIALTPSHIYFATGSDGQIKRLPR